MQFIPEKPMRTRICRSALIFMCFAGTLAGCSDTSSPTAVSDVASGGASISGGTSSSGGQVPTGTNPSGGTNSAGGQLVGIGGGSVGGSPQGGGQATGGAASGGIGSEGGSPSGGIGNKGGSPSGGIANKGGSSSGGATGGNASGGVGNPGGGAASGGNTNTGGVMVGGGRSTGGSQATGGGAAAGAPSQTCPATFSNPIIWQDLPDVDIFRVDDTYYYSASSFHFSPGAPLLRSYDLVNWEFIGHSVPALDVHASYDLNGSRSYNNGIWASSLRYRKSNDTWYWIGCMHNVGGGWVFTAPSPQGPWTKHSHTNCYYDVGLLIDDDDTMYVAYGNTTINVAQLSKDGFSQVKSQKVLDSPSDIGALEGSRMYKINGDYYIFVTQYANGEYVLRSTTGPFGPYTLKKFAVKLPFSVAGAGSAPHQGGIVDTQNGDWYYMAFNDSYPVGRIPVLAPMTWTDGWPSVNLVNNGWGSSYPFPKLPCGAGRVKPLLGTDTFTDATLNHEWEWNHNPDNTKWSVGSGLVLKTATVTNDLYAARNTLTHRMVGPIGTATIELDISTMSDGDVAGIAALRDTSAWVGVKKTAGAYKVVMVNNLTMDSSWKTTSTGTEAASAPITATKVWLRVVGNVRTDSGGGNANFYYSTDGSTFTKLGTTLTLNKDWPFFMGYRYGIFNFATTALGGSVKVVSFQLTKS